MNGYRSLDAITIQQWVIRRQELRRFADAPRKNSTLNLKLAQIVKDLQAELDGVRDLPWVQQTCITVLRQLAQCQAIGINEITARIRCCVSLCHPHPQTTSQVVNTLLGVVLGELGTSGNEPLEVTLDWLQEKSTYTLRADAFGNNPVGTCLKQVESHKHAEWTIDRHIAREALNDRLSEFLAGDKVLFVLVGESGMGKSWGLYHWLYQLLTGSIRVLLRGARLRDCTSLADCLHREFADLQLTAVSQAPEQFFTTFCAATSLRKPGVVAFDDLHSLESAIADRLDNVCRHAKGVGIKLVLSARESIWARFSERLRMHVHLSGSPELACSFRLSALESPEIEGIARSRGFEQDNVVDILRQAGEVALNPYLLNALLENFRRAINDGSLGRIHVDQLLEAETKRRCESLAWRLASYDRGELEQILLDIAGWFRQQGSEPLRKVSDLAAWLALAKGDSERRLLDALRAEDILTYDGHPRAQSGWITFTNPQFGEYITARWLASQWSCDGSPSVAEARP